MSQQDIHFIEHNKEVKAVKLMQQEWAEKYISTILQ
jgi:hypothetical protein